MYDVNSEDKTDDKQPQWHPESDQGKRAEAGYCNKLQMSQMMEVASRTA